MGDLVPLEVQGREPDLRVTLRIWRCSDGRAWHTSDVEEFVVEGQPEIPRAWLRWQLRAGLLALARRWRLGLVRRG